MTHFAIDTISLHSQVSTDPAVVDAGGGIVLGTAGCLGAVVLGAGGSAIARHYEDSWCWSACAGGHVEPSLAAPSGDPHESVWVEASPS